jgi:hypothetical protein
MQPHSPVQTSPWLQQSIEFPSTRQHSLSIGQLPFPQHWRSGPAQNGSSAQQQWVPSEQQWVSQHSTPGPQQTSKFPAQRWKPAAVQAPSPSQGLRQQSPEAHSPSSSHAAPAAPHACDRAAAHAPSQQSPEAHSGFS